MDAKDLLLKVLASSLIWFCSCGSFRRPRYTVFAGAMSAEYDCSSGSSLVVQKLSVREICDPSVEDMGCLSNV